MIPDTMIRLITCDRAYTRGNVYNYAYWRCGRCGWHPGSEQGPPGERCGSCGNRNYTDDPKEATALIKLVRNSYGYDYEMLQVLNHHSCPPWDRWLEMRRQFAGGVLSLCEGESK